MPSIPQEVSASDSLMSPRSPTKSSSMTLSQTMSTVLRATSAGPAPGTGTGVGPPKRRWAPGRALKAACRGVQGWGHGAVRLLVMCGRDRGPRSGAAYEA